jgi:hypothetical protein
MCDGGQLNIGSKFQLSACVSIFSAAFAHCAKWIIVSGNDSSGSARVWLLSNNIHPRVIFCSDGKGGGGACNSLAVGGWSVKADVGDVKVIRLALAAACPSHVSVWTFETLKPWHMLDAAVQPITFYFSGSKTMKSLGLAVAAAAAPTLSSASPDAAGICSVMILGHVTGALTAIQVKIDPRVKTGQQQQQHWRGCLQSPQIDVVAVQKHAHEGGVGFVECSKRFAFSIGSSDLVVAIWDLGQGGGTILGPVSCVVLYPILKMRPPSPSYHARVVAAGVGNGGVVVVMISNVGLVQVNPSAFSECLELPRPSLPHLSNAAAAALNRGDLRLLYPSSSSSSSPTTSSAPRVSAGIASVCMHPPLSVAACNSGVCEGVAVSCGGGAARAHGSQGQGCISLVRSSSPVLCAHSVACGGGGLLAMASASRVMLCPPPREIVIQVVTRGMRRWSASASFTIEAAVIECRGWGGDSSDVLTLRGEMKALSGGVYHQAEEAADGVRVLTGVLLSATALSDAEAVILRWRCGGGSNGGASLLIDSITLTDTLSRQTVSKSCCRSSSGSMGSSVSSSSLTSPGSGIVISLYDSTPPLTISDADTPAPYSTPAPPLDDQTFPVRPPARIGRCVIC